MRRMAGFVCISLLVAAPAVTAQEPDSGAGVAQPGGEERLPPLELTIDRSKVDLAGRRFELKMSRAAKKVRLRVLDSDGNAIAQEEIGFHGEAPGTPLTISWSTQSSAPVARVEVWGHDTFGYYAGVAIIPWSIRIPHEEVLFDNAKAEIKPEEEPKLEASYTQIAAAVSKHKNLGPIVLFIAGHTDRRGSEQSNLLLSRKRAQAIASWFRTRGLTIPIAFEGFGESVPAVKTNDGAGEPRNRRVDYILAIEPPRIGESAEPTAWKRL